MILDNTQIYTNRGWLRHTDVIWGDTTISYNPAKNVCEYDKITGIESTFHIEGLMNVNKLGVNQVVTLDHDLLVFDVKTREIERVPIAEKFMKVITGNKRLIYQRPIDYFHRTMDIEEIKWSARTCAIYAQNKLFRGDRSALEICDSLSGLEAQQWLDTFYHWNVLQSDVNWMKTCLMANSEIREKIFIMGPKAGVGVRFAPPTSLRYRKGNMWTLSIAKTQDVTVTASGWGLYEGNKLVFNLTTKNGSFLARRKNCTFIMACNVEEK